MSSLPTISRPAMLCVGKTNQKATRRAHFSRQPRFETLEPRVVFSADPVSAVIAEGGFCVPETAPSNPATQPPADYVSPAHPDFVGPRLPTTSPNHNAGLPADVNADGSVTPLDALRLTNKYNAAGTDDLASGEPDAVPTPAKADPLYWDVNDDGRFTPVDILWVVNWINTQASLAVTGGDPASVAEGEPDPSAPSPANASTAVFEPVSRLDLPTGLIGREGETVCFPAPAVGSLLEKTVQPAATESGLLTASTPERETQPSEGEDLLDVLAAGSSSAQDLFYGPLPADAFFGTLGDTLAA